MAIRVIRRGTKKPRESASQSCCYFILGGYSWGPTK
jgi:hypothetical protein